MNDIKLLECPTLTTLTNQRIVKKMRREIKEYIEVKGDYEGTVFIHVIGSYNFNIDNEDSAQFGRISDVEITKIESESHDDITNAVSCEFHLRAEMTLYKKLCNNYEEQINKIR